MRIHHALRFADKALEVLRQRCRRAPENLPDLAHFFPGAALIHRRFAAAALCGPKVPQRQHNVSRGLICPVFEQLDYVAGGLLVERLERPPGSSDDSACDPRPIDRFSATGGYSPSATGLIPEAAPTAWMASGNVVMSSQPRNSSSVTSG